MQEVFTNIYDKRVWGVCSRVKKHSVSFEDALVNLLEEYRVSTLLDIPCGPYSWMHSVMERLPNVSYLGSDIVKEVIDANNALPLSGSRIRFIHGDLSVLDLPEADLLLCRDCLVHLPYSVIEQVIKNITASPIKYLLTTTFKDRTTYQHDIPVGHWRPLNLELPPLSFPKPIEYLVEDCKEGNGEFHDKCLGLWEIEDLSGLFS